MVLPPMVAPIESDSAPRLSAFYYRSNINDNNQRSDIQCVFEQALRDSQHRQRHPSFFKTNNHRFLAADNETVPRTTEVGTPRGMIFPKFCPNSTRINLWHIMFWSQPLKHTLNWQPASTKFIIPTQRNVYGLSSLAVNLVIAIVQVSIFRVYTTSKTTALMPKHVIKLGHYLTGLHKVVISKRLKNSNHVFSRGFTLAWTPSFGKSAIPGRSSCTDSFLQLSHFALKLRNALGYPIT